MVEPNDTARLTSQRGLMPQQDQYIVKPIAKALNLLRTLGNAGQELTLSELSRLGGLPKSTTFKYLRTMLASGYIDHDPHTDTYRVGLVMWELGRLVGERMRVREVALPVMQELGRRFDETVNLGVLDGQEIVYVEMVESSQALRMRAELGGRDNVYSTALGKSMLAALPGESWRAHVPRRLPARTTRTARTIADLAHQIEVARTRHFAVDLGENEDGVWCIASAIRDHKNGVAGGISVSAPKIRLTPELEQAISQAVMEAANQIGQRLGHQPSSLRAVPGSGF